MLFVFAIKVHVTICKLTEILKLTYVHVCYFYDQILKILSFLPACFSIRIVYSFTFPWSSLCVPVFTTPDMTARPTRLTGRVWTFCNRSQVVWGLPAPRLCYAAPACSRIDTFSIASIRYQDSLLIPHATFLAINFLIMIFQIILRVPHYRC